MTQDEIIEMAREVGLPHWYQTKEVVNIERLEAFAKLVAAATRKATLEEMIYAHPTTAIEKAVAYEREAIAQMIDKAPPLVDFAKNEHGGCLVCGFTPKLAVKAIRARGEA